MSVLNLLCSFTESTQGLLRKDMDVNEHERLSNITLRLVQRDTAFIAVLHFIVTGESSTINITHTLFTSAGGSSTINITHTLFTSTDKFYIRTSISV